ncbi:hypothetical protein BKA62DRAFT_357859 [Auriculariales sp. MPI-PUGE-AT-0066]|nr:hypothetical protein BKA62DRAFT_357859 [Auriculariales sp. MPI-PUGE-AT-0066]
MPSPLSCPAPGCATIFTGGRTYDLRRHLNGEHLHCHWFSCPFCRRRFSQRCGAEKHAPGCHNRKRALMPDGGIPKECDARNVLLESWQYGMGLPTFRQDGSGDAEMIDADGNCLVSYKGRHEVVIQQHYPVQLHTPAATPFTAQDPSSSLLVSSSSEDLLGQPSGDVSQAHLRSSPDQWSPTNSFSYSPIHPNPSLFNAQLPSSATTTFTQLSATELQPPLPGSTSFLSTCQQPIGVPMSYSDDFTLMPLSPVSNAAVPLSYGFTMDSQFPSQPHLHSAELPVQGLIRSDHALLPSSPATLLHSSHTLDTGDMFNIPNWAPEWANFFETAILPQLGSQSSVPSTAPALGLDLVIRSSQPPNDASYDAHIAGSATALEPVFYQQHY